MKLVAMSFFLSTLLISTLSAQTYWEPTNGPYGGQVLAVHAVSNTHLYAHVSNLGMMVSTNAGQNWTASGLMGYFIGSMVSNGSGHVFAGDYNGGGVQHTTDNGATWNAANTNLTNLFAYALAIDGSDSVFVGTSGGGVFISHNGASWSPRNNGLTGLYVSSLTIDGNGDLFAATDAGVFRSTDNGQIWTDANNGLLSGAGSIAATGTGILIAGTLDGIYYTLNSGADWTLATTNVEDLDVRSLAVNTVGHGIAGTENGGIYISTDNGNTWLPRHIGVATEIVRGITVNSLNHIFVGSDFGGVYRSADNGLTWETRNEGLSWVSTNDLAATGSGWVFAGTDVGVFRTTDDGDNWYQVNTGLTETKVLSVAVGGAGDIFAGTNGHGCFKSTDGGVTWDSLPSLSSGIIRCLKVFGSTVYAGTYGAGIFRTTNNGSTWDQINTGLSSSNVYAIDAGASSIVYAGTEGGVYLSTNGGDSWAFKNALTAQKLLIGTGSATYAANGGGLFESTDQGTSWDQNAGASAATSGNALAYSATGDLLIAGSGGVHRSTNNGDTWEDISGGLPPYGVSAMVATSAGPIYTAVQPGMIYRSLSVPLSAGVDEGFVPREVVLHQNYPNPFNPATTIQFSIPTRSHVRITVHDLLGQHLGVIHDGVAEAGTKSLPWSGSVASGTYLIRMESTPVGSSDRPTISTRKMVLLK